jgi:transcriptional regulator of acetoin/glycerol metabolism
LTKESKGNTPHVDPELLRLILEHPWPGNIRQLHNALKIALALSDGRRTIGLDCLPSELLFAEPADQVGDSSHLVDNALRERFRALSVHDAQQLICVTRSKVEDDAIRNALASSNGNISAAARELGICRNTIYRRFYWID